MSNDSVRRINLGEVGCEPRPQLPDGFRRDSTRVGAALGAVRSGLSVYELPPGQAVSPYHYEEPEEEWLRVALAALVSHVKRGGSRRLAVERFDGEPVVDTMVMPLLIEAGFLAGPRRAVLRA